MHEGTAGMIPHSSHTHGALRTRPSRARMGGPGLPWLRFRIGPPIDALPDRAPPRHVHILSSDEAEVTQTEKERAVNRTRTPRGNASKLLRQKDIGHDYAPERHRPSQHTTSDSMTHLGTRDRKVHRFEPGRRHSRHADPISTSRTKRVLYAYRRNRLYACILAGNHCCPISTSSTISPPNARSSSCSTPPTRCCFCRSVRSLH